MTEIEIATEIETGIGMEIEIEIAGTTTTGYIAITTGTEMTDESIAIETGTTEMTGESIAIEMTADITAAMTTIVVMTTGAGMEDAGAIGMAATGFTKNRR